jgi:hypothetical protein
VRAILALVGDLLYLRANVAAVLVHIDLDGDRPHASSLIALAAGRQVASSWGATLYAAMIAHDAATGRAPRTQQILSKMGADKFVIATTDTPIAPLWASVGGAWQGVIDHLRPRLVLFGADAPSAAELAPRTGARIGARLLMRARTLSADDVELRDRDGGYVRIGDSGAAVAMVGRAGKQRAATGGDDDIDVVVLAQPGGADTSIELAATITADLEHTVGSIVVLGDDVVTDKKLVSDAKKLATQLGAKLVAGPKAGKAVPKSAQVDKTTALAPELCVAIGNAIVDVAGATSLVRVGSKLAKSADGALPGLADVGVRELVKQLADVERDK